MGVDGFECIIGMDWSNVIVQPWLDSLIDIVRIDRCMFGSHSPICNLAVDFKEQMIKYEELLGCFSGNDKQLFFHDVAQHWFQPTLST